MKRRCAPPGAAIVLLLALVVFDRQPVFADCRSFSDLIHHGGYGVSDREGRLLSSCNADEPFVPASILKIATAQVAIQILGRDYHFQSEWHLDAGQNLYLRGKGDPFLVAEEISLVLGRLQERGITKINGIYIDNSSFDLEGQVPGLGTSGNPYDVPVSATAVNFNTVAVRVGPDGKVRSAEAQTPTLPLMEELAIGLRPGEYRLNICRDLCRPQARSARLAAELLRALQRERGIPGEGEEGLGSVPAGAALVYTHRNSRGLEDVLTALLEHSNNYIANQVFLTCGAVRFGYPATWAKARQAAAEVLAGLLGPEAGGEVRMVEGSGLARENRVTARAMLKLLHAFASQSALLQKRDGVRLKSGSMAGVHNYAGYLPGGRSFVILENQPVNTRDHVLGRLQGMYPEERP